MNELKGACIIGQSGGPTSVINASAYGVIRTALDSDVITKVYGAANGIKGVLNDRLYDMDQEDFEELADFIEEARFEHAGVFTYSREEGTAAYDFPDQIEEQVKQDRMDILMRAQMRINAQQNATKIGQVIDVLCEDYDPVNETYFGRSVADAPDIDGKVFFRYRGEGRIAPGMFVKVKVREVVDYDVYGFAMTTRDAE